MSKVNTPQKPFSVIDPTESSRSSYSRRKAVPRTNYDLNNSVQYNHHASHISFKPNECDAAEQNQHYNRISSEAPHNSYDTNSYEYYYYQQDCEGKENRPSPLYSNGRTSKADYNSCSTSGTTSSSVGFHQSQHFGDSWSHDHYGPNTYSSSNLYESHDDGSIARVDHTYRDFSGVPPTEEDRERYMNKKREYTRRLKAKKDQSEGKEPATKPELKKRGRGNKASKSRGDSFVGFMGTNFPARLHDLLSHENGISDIIRWMPHGRSWIVLNKKEFLDKVAPSHFQISKFESFTRQVNGWGFKRITQGPDINSYYHEMFLRGMPHMIQWMKRTTSAGSGRRKIRADPKDEPNFYEISQMYPIPYYYGDGDGEYEGEGEGAKLDDFNDSNQIKSESASYYDTSDSTTREKKSAKKSKLDLLSHGVADVSSHYPPPLPSPLVVSRSYEGTSSNEDVVPIAPDEDAIDNFWANGQQQSSQSHHTIHRDQNHSYRSDYTNGHDVTPSDRNSVDEATIPWTPSYDDAIQFPYEDMNLYSYSHPHHDQVLPIQHKTSHQEAASDVVSHYTTNTTPTSQDNQNLRHPFSLSKYSQPLEDIFPPRKTSLSDKKKGHCDLNLQYSEKNPSNAGDDMPEWGTFI